MDPQNKVQWNKAQDKGWGKKMTAVMLRHLRMPEHPEIKVLFVGHHKMLTILPYKESF